MLKGAIGFAPAFLAGDSKGVTDVLGQMTGGAASVMYQDQVSFARPKEWPLVLVLSTLDNIKKNY